MADETKLGFEKHIQTLLQALICGGIIWLASTTNATQIKLAEVATKLDALQTQVVDTMQKRIDSLEVRVRELEKVR